MYLPLQWQVSATGVADTYDWSGRLRRLLLEDGKKGVTANCFGRMMTHPGVVRVGRHDTDVHLVTAA